MTDDDPTRRTAAQRTHARLGSARSGVAQSGPARSGYAPTQEEAFRRLLLVLDEVHKRKVAERAHLRHIARFKRDRPLGKCDPEIVAVEWQRLRTKYPSWTPRQIERAIADSQSYAFSTVQRRRKELGLE